MEFKEIKRSYKEERKTAKKYYKKEKRYLKKEYKNKREELHRQFIKDVDGKFLDKGKRPPINPPKRPLLEEIGNAVSHGLGSIFSIVALILMLLKSQNPPETAGAIIYFFGLFVMFTMSCLYHSFAHGSTVKRLFRRFDYSSIYLLIGATFAPVLLSYVGGTFGIVFFIIQWTVIVTGITFVGVFGPTRLKLMHIPLYVVLGWCALIFLPKMFRENPAFAAYILSGGIVYSLGIIPFAIKGKVAHFIWHLFVLFGAVLQWIGIYQYIYLV